MNFNRKEVSGLLSFMESNPQIRKGFVIYPGNEFKSITEKIVTIPDRWLLGCN